MLERPASVQLRLPTGVRGRVYTKVQCENRIEPGGFDKRNS